MRRYLPTVLLLAFALPALLFGLSKLQGVFAEERAEAIEAIEERRLALGSSARVAVVAELERRVRAARPAMEAAVADPLLEASGLLYVERGEVKLPRPASAGTTEHSAARRLIDDLRRPDPPPWPAPQSPWETRVALYRRFEVALLAGDDAKTTEAFRAILGHRAHFVLPAQQDLPYMVALLDLFESRGQPDHALMLALLRDGLPYGDGQRLRGLQRALLESRVRFDRSDFAFLVSEVGRISEKAGVRHDDFTARGSETPPKLAVPALLEAPTLLEGGRWLVVPAAEGSLQLGGRVDLGGAVARIAENFRQGGLLHREGLIELGPLGASTPLSQFVLHARSPRFGELRERAESRFRLKTGLSLLTWLMLVAIAGLVFIAQRRKARFLELKSDFVATVSHELRTPLASIRLLAETLEMRLEGRSEAKDYPARIVKDIDGLSFLIENILSFNRLEKGRITPRLGQVHLGALVGDLQSETSLFTTKAVEIESVGLDTTVVQADGDLLKLLFLNLARNACAYNERDPVHLRIEGARSEGGGFELHFGDNGVGIPETEREQVFGEFVRGSSRGRNRGSGLGLAICRRIMRVHGGSIRVRESGPEGTTFTLGFASR